MTQKPFKINLEGYEVKEAVVKTGYAKSVSGRLVVPKSWVGKKVTIVRQDP